MVPPIMKITIQTHKITIFVYIYKKVVKNCSGIILMKITLGSTNPIFGYMYGNIVIFYIITSHANCTTDIQLIIFMQTNENFITDVMWLLFYQGSQLFYSHQVKVQLDLHFIDFLRTLARLQLLGSYSCSFLSQVACRLQDLTFGFASVGIRA